MAMYGYARISTRDQDLAGQVAELTAAGCARVYREKVSGAETDRAELAKVIRRLEAGDVLVVTRLDRLARSTRDLLNVSAGCPLVVQASGPSVTHGPPPPPHTAGSC